MIERSPALIVTLPARSVAEAREQVEEAAASGADLAEVRFDRFDPEEIRRAEKLFPSPLPLIATLRSRIEGGEGPDSPEERVPLLRSFARLPFRWIDLEADRDRPDDLALPPAERLGRILSTHRLGPVDPAEWARWVRGPTPPGTVRKVVIDASVGVALRELIPALPPVADASAVAHTTGASGPLLRALARRCGFPMVYAALPEGHESGPSRRAVEPSQIPVDRLRRFFSAGERAPLFAIVGHPVGHSKSPGLHARWMRRLDRLGLYVALDLASEAEFVDSLPALAEWGFRGLNVTHPWKRAALAVATEVGPGARACGVANCLTLRGSEIEAENTDLTAILRRMEELLRDGSWDGRSVSVVGTGGAARATLAAARTLRVPARVYGRSPDHVESVARAFEAEPRAAHGAEPDGLVVHATDVGRSGARALDLALSPLLRPGSHVIDWVYDADPPCVRDEARRAGATYEDGARLLVYQAAASFGIWWGEEPGEAELKETLGEEGCTA